MTAVPSAKVFAITPREVVAVEHPMMVKNIDSALKTFGTGDAFKRILDSDDQEGCLPLYIRHKDPMCAPTLSHNSSTNNVLLKITVPKRTGRKRKRGSQDPYFNCEDIGGRQVLGVDTNDTFSDQTSLRSHSRLDDPRDLLRTLKDTVGNHSIEAVAEIEQTHRFRGLADFHQSTAHGEFIPKFREGPLTGQADKMRQFQFDLRRGWKPNEEFLPPPAYTDRPLPYNWGWHQNSNSGVEVNEATGESILVNRARPPNGRMEYLPHDVESIPQGPSLSLPNDPILRGLIAELQEAMEERPIWTRRALTNRLGDSPLFYLIKHALQFVSYQFRGGPFRDAIIKYGVDPRTDKKYHIYQTLFFKLYNEEERAPGMPWHDIRSEYTKRARNGNADYTTHLFNGKTITLDGKIWQICDVTDPLLVQVINASTLREKFDSRSDGWFTNGAWAKIKAIMKTKLIAIRAQKTVLDEEFTPSLQIPDIVAGRASKSIVIPVPDVRLAEDEVLEMKERGELDAIRGNGMRKREKVKKPRYLRIRSKIAAGRGRPTNTSQKVNGSGKISIKPPNSDLAPDKRALEAVSELAALDNRNDMGQPTESRSPNEQGVHLSHFEEEKVGAGDLDVDQVDTENENTEDESEGDSKEDASDSGAEGDDYDSDTSAAVDFA